MVDALGGVTVNVCGPIIDGELGTVIADGGVQTIQGNTALNLVRARKVEGDTDSDLARIRRQQIVLSAILQQVTSAGTLLNPAQARRVPAGLRQQHLHRQCHHRRPGDAGPVIRRRWTPAGSPSSPCRPCRASYDSEALDPDETKAPAVFSALLNDQPLPGEPAATSAAAETPAPTRPPRRRRAPTGKTVDPECHRSGHRQSDGPDRGGHRNDGRAQRHRFHRLRRRSARPGRAAAERHHRRVRPEQCRAGADCGRRGTRPQPWCRSPAWAPRCDCCWAAAMTAPCSRLRSGAPVTGTLAEGTTGASAQRICRRDAVLGRADLRQRRRGALRLIDPQGDRPAIRSTRTDRPDPSQCAWRSPPVHSSV